jgi:hypothetical protein
MASENGGKDSMFRDTDWNRCKFSTFKFRTTAHSYGARNNTTTETTFTISGARDSCNVPEFSLTCIFVYGLGLQPAGVILNNFAGYTHQLLFVYVRTATQPSIKLVSLCHKKVGRFYFIESRVFRYQPFVLVHNARLYSECYTIEKGYQMLNVEDNTTYQKQHQSLTS